MNEKTRLQKLAEMSNDLEALYNALDGDTSIELYADKVFMAWGNVDKAIIALAQADAAYKGRHGQGCTLVI